MGKLIRYFKNWLLFVAINIFFIFSILGQVNGDYRSKLSGTWAASSSWEIYNSTTLSWENATSYPGQNLTVPNPTVTILSGHTIDIPTTFTIANNILEISVYGNFILGNGTSSTIAITIPASLFSIKSTGIVNFNGTKVKLTLSITNSVFIIESGGNITGSCNNNNEIFIGTHKYAVCNGAGGVLTFGELVASGGNINSNIITPIDNAFYCLGNPINLQGEYASADALNVNYLWVVRDSLLNIVGISNFSGSINGVLANTSSLTTPIIFNPPSEGIYLVSLEVTTTSGTIITNVETKTIIVEDNINPTITAPPATTGTTNAGCTSTNVVLGTPTTADNCSVASVTNNAPIAFPLGTTTVTWTVTDGSGRTATATQLVTVTDNINPTITAPANTTGTTNVGCTSTNVVLGTPTTADNCSVASVTNNAPVAFPLGTTTVTWTVTDGSGRTATATQLVTVTDNINPTITAPPATTGTTNVGCTSINVVLGTPTTADNCSVATISHNAPVAFPIGTTTVTWTVTDGSGRTATATQLVTVTDNINPTITCTSNITQNVGVGSCTASVVTPNPTTADNCSVTRLTWALTGTTIASSPATGINNLGMRVFNLGVTTVTYRVEDAAGNFATCSYTVTVTDNINPTISCTSNISQNVGVGSCTASVTTPNPTTADNCSVTLLTWALTGSTVASSPATGINNLGTRVFNLGVTTVTYRVEDAAGNFATCSYTVTVTDNINPTITAPPATTGTTNVGCTSTNVVLGTPITADNCSVASVTNNAPATFPLGNTTVTWTVIDGSGRTATATQLVTVTDNFNPTITPGADQSVFTASGLCTASVNVTNAIFGDNCTVATISHVLSGANTRSSTNGQVGTFTFNRGVTTITYTVRDGATPANIITGTKTITVVDNQNPTLTSGANQSAFTASGSCTASINVADATFGDNCTGATISHVLSGATIRSSTNGQVGTFTFNRGVTIITYTVTDASGNTITGSKTVTVTDNIPPAIPVLNNIIAQCSVTVTAPTTTDNCAGIVIGTTGDYTIPHTFNTEGTYPIVWRFDDGNGNVITITQNVIIDDTVAPVPNIANLPNITVNDCSLSTLTAPTATDNCKGAIIGTTNTPLPITTIGTSVVTWTYNDGNGNITTQTQNVILTKPTISGGSLLGYVSDIYTVAEATDNIAITSCPDDINPIIINLTGNIGTIIHWEKFEAGDTQWRIIPGTINNNTNSYNINFDFQNTKSTLFRVLVQVGNCTVYSNMVNVHAVPPDVPPILEEDYFNICLNDEVTLVASNGYTSTVIVGEGGDFNLGQFPDKWDPTQWKIDDKVSGTSWTAAANNTKANNWTGTNDAKNVGTNYIIKYDNGRQGKKFGMAHGNFNSTAYQTRFPDRIGLPTTLETPIFSLVGLGTAAVAFDQAYNLHAGDYAKLELSLDGGLTYTITLQELIGKNPPLTWDWSNPKNRPPSTANNYMFANDNSSFDISAYIGNDNVRVRWSFWGTTDESVWAIDNITIPIKPYSDILEWTDGIGEPGEYIVRGALNVSYTFTPSSPGVHQYGATSLINGCRAYDPKGTALATVVVNYAYAGEDRGFTNAQCGERTVMLNAFDNSKTADQNKANGAYPLPLNDFSDDPGTGATGKWSVFNTTNTCGTYSFSDITSPTSSFSGDAGVYTLRWTLDVSGCYDEVMVTLTNCNVIDFDGVDDYIAFKNNYSLGNTFSIEIWIKPDPQPTNPQSNIQSIISKRDANNLTTGYDLRLIGSSLSFNWNNSAPLVSPYQLTTSRWYHVAVTYSSGIYKLFVDGIEVNNQAGSAPITNNFEFIAGAMDQTGNPPNKPVNHYSGWMDELRIWDIGLNSEHIRQMMNQQIINNGTAVRGEVIPININGPDANKDGVDDQPLFWSNLKGYYRMDQIDCGYLKPYGGVGVDGKLRNITSSQEETAPLPYESIRDGNWTDRNLGTTPWRWGATVWDFPNSTGYNNTSIDWNIVRINHNITSGNKDITLLGLLSETANKQLIMANPNQALNENNSGQGLWITHYLKLVGNIDLVGESQLLQKRYGSYNLSEVFITNQFSESILDENSPGFIERDQQGTQSSFNYNYWSSPVSYQGAPNNAPFTVAQMLLDGTNSANPNGAGPIQFDNWHRFADFALTYPIKLSNYWLWKHNGTSGIYEEWKHIGSTGLVYPGEGYTMKGTSGLANISDKQNYVFRGKPNNADITLSIMAGNNRLIGNPYPSALDAQEFILDHIKDNGGRNTVNVINGTLYFWDHFSGKTHNLAGYIGGYATYTLMGGVNAISNDYRINAIGATGFKVPERFIAVGQGFFVNASADVLAAIGSPSIISGGNIVFKNNQRAFKRETVTTNNTGSVFIRTAESSKTKNPSNNSKTIEVKTDIDSRQKIRLMFDSPEGFYRELLVGIDPRATNSFDIGFDGPLADDSAEDLYWIIDKGRFVIQGVNNFNKEQEFPLGIKLKNTGIAKIKLDSLENINEGIELYIKDYLTGETFNLNDKPFEINLEAGEYKDRFALVFQPRLKTISELNLEEGIQTYINNDNSEIQINKILDTEIKEVILYNYLGQKINSWDSEINHRYNSLPVNVATGVYIIKITTTNGIINKKLFIERK